VKTNAEAPDKKRKMSVALSNDGLANDVVKRVKVEKDEVNQQKAHEFNSGDYVLAPFKMSTKLYAGTVISTGSKKYHHVFCVIFQLFLQIPTQKSRVVFN
jgi:hypothetical protein